MLFDNVTTNRRFLILVSLCALGIACLKATLAPYFFPAEGHHYINISWHLWQQPQWLLLHDDAGLYLNKPPLLFWLIKSLWTLTGPSNWWFVLLPTAFAVGTLWLLALSFENFWPAHRDQAFIAPAILFGSVFFASSLFKFSFDGPMVFFAALGLWGLSLTHQRRALGWTIFGIAMGLGCLMKGPVILCFTAVPAILMIATGERKNAWLGLAGALGLAALIVCAWLVPLASTLGLTTIKSMVFKQGLGLHHAYHAKPLWYYLKSFPALLLPWLVWPTAWRAVKEAGWARDNQSMRFCLLSLIAIFCLLSVIPAKASRYILPLTVYSSVWLAACLVHYRGNITPNRVYQFAAAVAGIVLLFAAPFAGNITAYFGLPSINPSALVLCGGLFLLASLTVCQNPKGLSQIVLTQCLIGLLFVFSYLQIYIQLANEIYNIEPLQQVLLLARDENKPLAYVYTYAGYIYSVDKNKRLPAGDLIRPYQLKSWLKAHPSGLFVARVKTHTKTDAFFAMPMGMKHKIIVSNRYLSDFD
jgi:4-amino-4-deoxy-L-arabinose transferase-like glycosyltransferase